MDKVILSSFSTTLSNLTKVLDVKLFVIKSLLTPNTYGMFQSSVNKIFI